jgi:hypothetical protein
MQTPLPPLLALGIHSNGIHNLPFYICTHYWFLSVYHLGITFFGLGYLNFPSIGREE